MAENRKPTRNFSDLVEIMTILRKECPWDRKQTHESIKDLMVEEIYEAIEAIDDNDPDELRKELGDLLLHVVFQTEIARESGRFDIGDVIWTIQEKLIRRHPHVFEDTDAADSETVKRNWEDLKMKEGERKSVLQGVPDTLPALIKAYRMQDKAAGVGFDWKSWKLAWPKLQEEIEEFRQAAEKGSEEERNEEFGDLLFSMVNVGRLMGINAEDALRMTNRKFKYRFQHIEKVINGEGKNMRDTSLEEMDRIWDAAKGKSKSKKGSGK
ncbi:nucleoside triphosphate pyrophosphohydrolase [Natronogracilivirga saccharolytica]|uniref:Nucleoside triphosphate pyrophosphohydrolase n=1 Tax=Natronogracilivirga saccharolytica TaxID=2812953 RepID=A0A8J7UWS4_9BACT|nr:nucleoside triphosphate pyrophosphohydrolase [Natronogracilivirga saccharolytica]MBP3192549.1 nucleoside triphosphate pyrophosphohydrolase [Natronogracilivirga saccharolytica]